MFGKDEAGGTNEENVECDAFGSNTWNILINGSPIGNLCLIWQVASM